jgi:hypothetical protein
MAYCFLVRPQSRVRLCAILRTTRRQLNIFVLTHRPLLRVSVGVSSTVQSSTIVENQAMFLYKTSTYMIYGMSYTVVYLD